MVRYLVRPGSRIKHPYEVFDSRGGWVCSSHATYAAALKRAQELNKK